MNIMMEYKITGGLKLFVYYLFVGTIVILTNFTLNGKFLVVRLKNLNKSFNEYLSNF